MAAAGGPAARPRRNLAIDTLGDGRDLLVGFIGGRLDQLRGLGEAAVADEGRQFLQTRAISIGAS